jgi:hypothetical protein
MTQGPFKAAVKRGALVAAANWPVSLIQASADSLFKLLLAAPLVGGVFLVALAVGDEPGSVLALESREMIAAIGGALMAQPAALAAFALAVAIVVVGGSLFVFLIKGGTVATLVRSERESGPIEEPPLHVSTVARAGRFSVDAYVESARRLFPRYARLGVALMGVYLVSGLAYLAVIVNREAGAGWGVTAAVTVVFALWITVVNLLYLLVQIVIAADDCGVAAAARNVAAFLRHERRRVAAVFGLVLGIIVAATGASVLATAALGLVAFVPFFGLAALPLQLLAWLLRGLVFQYVGLASVGAYLKLYRGFSGAKVQGFSESGSPVPVHG